MASYRPTAEITSPVKDYFDSGESIPLEAQATAYGGSKVQRVEFIVDGITIASDTDAPYVFNWTGAVKGRHSIKAKVYDSKGLVAYYALDNDASDSSGNNLNGTLVGDPGFVEGVAGMALEFDGVDDRVAIADDAAFDAMSEKFTITAWIKLSAEGTTGRRPILSKELEPNTDGRGWEFKVNNGQLAMQLYSPVEGEGKLTTGVVQFQREGITNIQAVVLPIGEWAHVAATFDGTTGKIYINGLMIGEGAFSFGSDPEAAVQFGACEANGGNPFNGALDEIRIYDIVLSDAEILELEGK